ncbi:MAG TPA: M60 family metallopeptidase [Phycisphaerae bacterium]|nr:M60 family metallopeptidase [Phycisphaerae bacterium]
MNRKRDGLCAAAALLACGLGSAVELAAGQGDVAFLLGGVKRIASPGIPGPLCVWGKDAFPVATAPAGGEVREPVVAAARLGKGRLVALGHTGYLDGGAFGVGDTSRLLANAVRWAAGRTDADGKPVRVGVHQQADLAALLAKQGMAVRAMDGADWAEKLAGFDVVCLQSTAPTTPARRAALGRFVEGGGGAVLAGLGWGWLQLNPGKDLLADHPGNLLLARAGIVWSDGYLTGGGAGGYEVAAPSDLAHAAGALDALAAHAEKKRTLSAGQLAQAGAVVSRTVRSLPPGEKLLDRLRALSGRYAAEAVPSHAKPLRQGDALQRVLLAWQLQEADKLPPEQVRAHPAAEVFPGAVPADAPRVTRTVEIDTAVPDWHSTGLYAAPGEVVTVELPAEAAKGGLVLRLGAHKHGLWGKDVWRRCPSVLRVVPLAGRVTAAASAFGGLIYVDVPRGCALGRIGVTVAGAVEAPRYVHGTTSAAEWRKGIRSRPAPWAELATEKVILTVPSAEVRGLDDPNALMGFWDRVLDACAELACRPKRRPRPERYVADEQLTAGYMHAGYPIMTHLDAPRRMVDPEHMRTKGDWGLFHEMGHNHQSGDWTFAGTGEVTVNLFTLYVMETVCGRGPEAHGSLRADRREKMIRDHLAGGRDFEKWKQSPFLALLMYAQLRDAFGWEAYRKVFAEYRDLPRGQRPRSDEEKRDQWMVRFSRAVGRDLGPFFQAWGVPTSEKARASIADLPGWMPDGFPPKPQRP